MMYTYVVIEEAEAGAKTMSVWVAKEWVPQEMVHVKPSNRVVALRNVSSEDLAPHGTYLFTLIFDGKEGMTMADGLPLSIYRLQGHSLVKIEQ